MKQNLQIQIPTPCHENWNAMTPENKGRFCGSCAKTVVDFSLMTDNEVLNFLKKHTGNTCGHFTSDQLQRPIIETQLQPKKTWRYWLASIASLLIMLQRSAAQTKTVMTQGKVLVKKSIVKQVAKKVTLNREIIVGMIMPEIVKGDIEVIEQPIAVKKFIEGIVVNESNQPIAFVSVTTKVKLGITSTDSLGKFFIDNKYLLDSISLVVSSIGYEPKELSIAAKTKAPQFIQLKKKAVQLPEVALISYGSTLKGKMVMGGISSVKNVSKRDTIPLAIAKVFNNEAFTIYPNPVNKNGTINISVKEAGIYEVQVSSNQSKLLYSQQHNTQFAKQAVQFAVPAGALPGMYYLRLLNTVTHKQWVDKLMIQ